MLNRKAAPPFVSSSSFNLIRPEENALPNGVRVFFVSGGSQDVLKIELIFDAGKWFERTPGAAYFTSHLLSKGTRGKNSFDIAQLFDRYGAHLEVHAGVDFVSIALYSLTRNLAPVLELLMEILSEPTFPEKEFQQARSVFIQNLRVNNEKTSYVASKVFRKSLFGEHHPYGSDLEEPEANALEISHLQSHFSQYINSATLFVSGKIEADNKALILKTFAKAAAGTKRQRVDHAIAPGEKRQRVKKKDSVQSSLRMGGRSLMRSHSDYVPLLFVSHILGGYFGSRLMKNIREEKGLTYGIGASLHALRHNSYLLIGADVNKENVDLTFEEIRKELKRLRTTKVPDAELTTTRNHFIGSLQSEITTPFAHAEKIKTIHLFNLGPDHYQQMIERIENITPSEIVEISEKYLDENSFHETAVG
ncbi:MAG TPA: pitrilysin family protein [Chryseosolibacter sp.]